jgi:calcium permeable stress-gated cation channel
VSPIYLHEDVFWKNVGKTHHELSLGKLLSFGLTTALCLFWTIPMGFISSLSSIEGLRGEFGAIDKLLTAAPWLEPVFSQLAPLLIILANNVLKMVLELLSGLEGPISGAVVSSKLFTKLSIFMIIQTFFVTALSGSIMDELSAMLKDSSLIIDLLAQSLPRQSTFFIQILVVDTCISMGVELLRVVPLVMALIRRFVGPRLTQKERKTTWMGIRPLNDPSTFSHAEVLASTVLYYTVFFVYATLAPITTWFMLLCFSFMTVGYRHQFVYIYPTFPDSGGKLWVAFFKLLPSLMIMAQVTLVGVLALSKSAVASAMMIPLLIITILFTVYINQQHFAMTEHLPAKDALMADLRYTAEREMDYDFLKDKYIQPELREREVWPENFTVEREIENGCLEFRTPPGSEAGDDDGERGP